MPPIMTTATRRITSAPVPCAHMSHWSGSRAV